MTLARLPTSADSSLCLIRRLPESPDRDQRLPASRWSRAASTAADWAGSRTLPYLDTIQAARAVVRRSAEDRGALPCSRSHPPARLVRRVAPEAAGSTR